MGKWAELPIPFKGVKRSSFDVLNALELSGYFYTMEGWQIVDSVLSLLDGEAAAYAAQTYAASQSVQLIHPHNGNVYYVTEKELRKIESAHEHQISSSFLTSSPTTRLSSVLFRNRILVASPLDGLFWIDPSSDTFRAVGVAAPTTVPTAAAGSASTFTGRYRYTVTYVNDQGHESDPKTTNGMADYVEITVTETNVNLSAIPTGPTGTASRRIYRTINQGEEFLYLTNIANNTATTLTDYAPDISLGSPLAYDNDAPPTKIRNIFKTAQRVYLIDGDDGKTLWASRIDPYTATPLWESYPTNLSVKLPFDLTQNPFQAGWELNSFVYVASKYSIHRIYGDVGTGISIRKILDEGLFSRFSYALTPTHVVYVNAAKKLMKWNGDSLPEDIGFNVQGLLDDMIAPSGLYETTVVYDPAGDYVQVYYNTSGGIKSVQVSLSDGMGWDAPTALQIPLYSYDYEGIIGARAGLTTIYGTSGFKYDGARRSTQTAEFYSITPSPGKDVYIARIKIEAKAIPIISYVPPMLSVEVGFNDSPVFKTTMLDLSRDNMMAVNGNTPVKKTLYVPVYRRAESLQIRLKSVNNSASLNNNIEIFKISLEVEAEQSKQSRGNWTVDKEN